MSYCRWSDDDHACDVYVYEHCEGYFAIHVAAYRMVFDGPLPDPIPYSAATHEAWFARYWHVSMMLDQATRVPIGLPHDGENIKAASAGECADELERLRAIGYRVPQHAIDTLRQEDLAP